MLMINIMGILIWILFKGQKTPCGVNFRAYNEIYVGGKRLSVVDVHRDSLKWPHQIITDVIGALISKCQRHSKLGDCHAGS